MMLEKKLARDEKIKMYMGETKRRLAEMLVSANDALHAISRRDNAGKPLSQYLPTQTGINQQ